MTRLPFSNCAALLSLLLLLFPAGRVCANPVQTYRIGGTGSALATIRLLAQEFHAQNPATRIRVLPSLGTTGGIRALQDKALDLALAARPLTEQEKSPDFTYRPYAQTAIAFVTHPDVAVENLTTEEIAAILKGDNKFWPNGDYIRVVMRALRESDFIPIIQNSPPLATALNKAAQRTELLTSATTQENVHILLSLPGSFGISCLAQLESEQLKLKTLTYNGVQPSIENLRSGRYPFHKTFALVYRPEGLPGQLQAFVDYISSPAACRVLEKNGHICIGNQ